MRDRYVHRPAAPAATAAITPAPPPHRTVAPASASSRPVSRAFAPAEQ